MAQARQLVAQMTETARGEGLDFDYDALQHTNTLRAHQVLHLAKAHGLQREMKERLLRAAPRGSVPEDPVHHDPGPPGDPEVVVHELVGLAGLVAAQVGDRRLLPGVPRQ